MQEHTGRQGGVKSANAPPWAKKVSLPERFTFADKELFFF